MRDNTNITNSYDSEPEIDIQALLKIISNGKILIGSVTFIFSLIAVLISLYLPNIYQSKALLSPVNQQNSGMDSMGSISGLANLAGISLSAQAGGNTTKAITKINTISFFENNILPNISILDLAAVDSWDSESNTISYNKKLYDPKTNILYKEPSLQKSHKAFLKKIDVRQDVNSGFVTISVKHHSPYIAKEWNELIVNQINKFFRTQDEQEAVASMNFLNAQMALTSYTEIKEIIAQLLQQNIQKLTLIEATDFYVFSYLDFPIVEEEKVEPARRSIAILGAVLGLMLGILIVLIPNFTGTKKQS